MLPKLPKDEKSWANIELDLMEFVVWSQVVEYDTITASIIQVSPGQTKKSHHSDYIKIANAHLV